MHSDKCQNIKNPHSQFSENFCSNKRQPGKSQNRITNKTEYAVNLLTQNQP